MSGMSLQRWAAPERTGQEHRQGRSGRWPARARRNGPRVLGRGHAAGASAGVKEIPGGPRGGSTGRPPTLPFRSMSRHGWSRLGLFALALLYVAYFGINLLYLGTMNYIAIDYRANRASAEIALRHGFQLVYDLDYQDRYQRPLYESYVRNAAIQTYATVPMPYLPPFILLFVPLLAFDPLAGFAVFTAASLTALVLYLLRFWRALTPARRMPMLMALGLWISLPSMTNAVFGQVNVWLTICVGEFIIWQVRGKKLLAGLWLGGLLLKPQSLTLLVLLVVLASEWRTLLGFLISAIAALGGSLALAGPEGLGRWAALLLTYPQSLPTTYPESMMNWRALGILLESILGTDGSRMLVLAGMILTTTLTLPLAKRLRQSRVEDVALACLGALSGAIIVSWHSHIHMALPLIIPLAALFSRGLMSRKAITQWSLLPGAVLAGLGIVSGPGLAHIASGLTLFAFNLMFVFLGLASSRNRSTGDLAD